MRGTLRITAPASFAHSHIVPFVPEFLPHHPALRLDQHLSDMVVDLVEQGFDLAFRVGALQPSSLLARKIDDNPMVPVATPKYLERYGIPQTPGELRNHVCLPMGRNTVWRFRGPDGKQHDVSVGGPLSVNLGDAIGEWVLANVGIGLASLWHAGRDLRAGQLARILPGFHVFPRTQIWAVRPPARVMPSRVEAFLSFIERRIREANHARYGDMADWQNMT
ncbi:substrate binding domain-containing protein [Shinella sp. 838]|uniref:substrate binding domain-containing protein n=1 Tax=Shinella sp. 838 TaxID=3038164 RepID=UPI0024153CEC|nr:substrate binding domain-containing protein [Shinella sp. 838]MDG4674906.1 substrate binding domain-containing protein [Shinella sp. 838]